MRRLDNRVRFLVHSAGVLVERGSRCPPGAPPTSMVPDDDFRDVGEQLSRDGLALQAVIEEVQHDDVRDVDHSHTVDGPSESERLEEGPYIGEISEIEMCRALDAVVPKVMRGR